MTKRKKSSPFSKHTSAGDYDVGYGKPPKGDKFQPGKSGNPRGRPKGAKNKARGLRAERLKKIVLDEAARVVKTHEKGQPVKMTVATAVIRTLAHKALKGETRALKLFAEMQMEAEAENRREHGQLLDEMLGYKARCEREIERCKAQGIEPPNFLPHPDDIVVEPATGDLIIKGPMSKEEKVVWDEWREKAEKYEAAIAEVDVLIKEDEYAEFGDSLVQERQFYAEMRDICKKVLQERRFPAP